MKDKMKVWLLEYFKNMQLPTRRKKINIQQIEDYLIKGKLKDPIRYQTENGYRFFVQLMNELTVEGVVSPIKKSSLRGRHSKECLLIIGGWLNTLLFN